MKVRRALAGFGVISVIYILALIWGDSRSHLFTKLPSLLPVLPCLMGLSFIAGLLRYVRWYWLLRRAGSSTHFFRGALAYWAGFAFTATPGKVGELLRIRYLLPQGVPAWKVLSAFVYERAFDLLSVLLLAAVAVSNREMFVFVLVFVAIFLALLVFTMLNPVLLTRASIFFRRKKLRKLARLGITLRNGLSGCRVWATPLDVMVSMLLGLLAWSLISFSFVWLLSQMGIQIPLLSAVTIYPLAMLAGAASMLPGGVGSTEVAIVALLSHFGVTLGSATLAAVGIRFSSMWFAVLCGFCALGVLELPVFKEPLSIKG